MSFSRRAKMILGSPVSMQFELPSDALLLTHQRLGSTGTVRTFSGILMAAGEITNHNNISLWDYATHTEIEAIVVPSAMLHSDSSIMSVGIGFDGDYPDGKQFYIRKTTAPLKARISHPTRARVPASFLTASRAHQCGALPKPYKLASPDEMTPSQSTRFNNYKTWQTNDDMYYASRYLNQGPLAGRFAQYGRVHQLCCASLMSQDARFMKHGLSVMDSGATATAKWLDSLSTRVSPYTGTGSDTRGNIGAVGSEPSLDMLETFLPYLLTLCDDYLLALDSGGGWLHDATRLGIRYGGTTYNVRSGCERLFGRAIYASNLIARAQRSFTVAVLQSGDEANGNLTGPAYLSAHMNRALTRLVLATGESVDPILRERGTIARATDTTKISIGPMDILDTVANLSAPITIPQQDVTIPAGATMAADATIRAINVLLEWNGTNVVAKAGTMRVDAYNAGTQPWRGTSDANMPAVTAGSRAIGHVVIFAEANQVYTANVTALPVDSAPSNAHIKTGGITCWMFCDTRNWGQKAYMIAETATAFIDFIETYPADANTANLTTAVTNLCTWLWNNAWLPASRHFTYVTVESGRNGYANNQAQGGRTPSVQWKCLNGTLCLPFAWLAYKTGSTTWRDRYDAIEAAAYEEEFGTSAGWSSPGQPATDDTQNHMSGDQAYRNVFQAMWLRNNFVAIP